MIWRTKMSYEFGPESDIPDEEPGEGISDDIGIEPGSPEYNWITGQGPIYDQPLDDVLDDFFGRDNVSKTGIRFMPVGLKTFFRRVKQRKKCSQQTVQYHASRHGCMIAIRDPRIKELMRLYDLKLNRAEEDADVALLKRLEERDEAVDYTYPEEYKTSVILPKDMSGLLSSMADAIGVSAIKLYCWLCIISALTLKMPVAGRKVLEDEAKHFWSIVEERVLWLSQKTPERKNAGTPEHKN
jgi:hypothetical protein